jgi:hypothetical protein
MHVLVIVNPRASRAETAPEELSRWFSGHAAIFFRATSIDELKQTLYAHGANADRIVIGGGDGTISAALPTLLRLGKPLAVLPLGTANDFARTLGVPADAMEAAEIAIGGCEHCIDVGRVNGRPFIMSGRRAGGKVRRKTRRLCGAGASSITSSVFGGGAAHPFVGDRADGAPTVSAVISERWQWALSRRWVDRVRSCCGR